MYGVRPRNRLCLDTVGPRNRLCLDTVGHVQSPYIIHPKLDSSLGHRSRISNDSIQMYQMFNQCI